MEVYDSVANSKHSDYFSIHFVQELDEKGLVSLTFWAKLHQFGVAQEGRNRGN